ncbi:uncharacterized protein VTP21DRAFT_3623 [Calcarisporiella thermophila]|uniref:uncharacterized protein n=1 Tax=Calcarisporiella thermophila TaxID=911321 RepID=UPI0037422BFC
MSIENNRGGRRGRQGRGGIAGRNPSKKHQSTSPHSTREKKSEPNAELEQKEMQETTTPKDAKDLCFICAEPVIYYSVTDCNHRTCHLCCLRLRALYKSKLCVYCKTEQQDVIFTRDSSKPFEDYNRRELPFSDEKLSILFEDEQIYGDTMIMLRFNCPDPNCDISCDGGWGELKRHVKKNHGMSLCDLCIRHKKIFAHEHTLFTPAQLNKHYKYGDDSKGENQSGFKGHPECQFCRISYYGDDELFEHCRDKHEQCFICVRNGTGRHQYYANYDSLAEHFRRDHYICGHAACLEKKFVVFETDIDLKAHEVISNSLKNMLELLGGGQRARIRQLRQIEVNFTYSNETNQSERSSRRSRRQGRSEEQNEREERPLQTDTNSQSRSVNGNDISRATRALRISQERNRSRQPAINVPAGFGALSDSSRSTSIVHSSHENSVTLEPIVQTNSNSTQESAASTFDTQMASRHQAYLDRLRGYLKGDNTKLGQFRTLTSTFRTSMMPVDDYVDALLALFGNNTELVGKTIQGLLDLLDKDDKRFELQQCWNDRRALEQQFPMLESIGVTASPSSSSSGKSRVLAVKSRGVSARASKNVWDRVAAAASQSQRTVPQLPDNLSSSSRQSTTAWSSSSPSPVTKQTQPQFVQTSSGTSSGIGSSSASWAARSGSQIQRLDEDFPSLPSAPRQNRIVVGGRNRLSPFQDSGPTTKAWNQPNEEARADVSSDGNDEQGSIGGKKKKNKSKKQLLFHVGL